MALELWVDLDQYATRPRVVRLFRVAVLVAAHLKLTSLKEMEVEGGWIDSKERASLKERLCKAGVLQVLEMGV